MKFISLDAYYNNKIVIVNIFTIGAIEWSEKQQCSFINLSHISKSIQVKQTPEEIWHIINGTTGERGWD